VNKFGRQVANIKSQPKGDKPSLKGAWLHHVTNFIFSTPEIYLE